MASTNQNASASNEDNDTTLYGAVKNLLDGIQLLKDFTALYLRRDEVSFDIQELESRVPDIQQQMFRCNETLRKLETTIKQEYKNVTATMHNQQMAMLHLLGEIQKKKNQSNGCNQRLANKSPQHGSLLEIKQKLPALETPRMLLSEYVRSPYVSKLRPVTLSFIDFDATFSIQQFNAIPKYLRGRESYDDLHNFLQSTIVPCFTEKYQLLHRKRNCILNTKELELWKMYHDQVSYFPGQKFITQGDLSREAKKPISKQMSTRITMLRHLGILQEQRKPPIVCYIWITNKIGANN